MIKKKKVSSCLLYFIIYTGVATRTGQEIGPIPKMLLEAYYPFYTEQQPEVTNKFNADTLASCIMSWVCLVVATMESLGLLWPLVLSLNLRYKEMNIT